MTHTSPCRKFQAEDTWPRRALPCLVRGSICPTPLRALRDSKIYPKLGSFAAAATSNIARVRSVGKLAFDTVWLPASCMTSATWFPPGLATSSSFTRGTVAPSAASSLTRTCPTMLCPKPTTPIASFPWQSGWWSKTACPIKSPVGICGAITGFLSPSPPSKTGWRPGGKKAASQMEIGYLDWALADFSGYIAADELYDGPFCVLSIVDNRTFKRLIYQVLDHDPNHQDITAFLRRFQAALRQRSLALNGVTTDASPLYPEPLQAVFGEVLHQICEFHILKELTKAILRAVAKVRKKLAARKPTLKRGRPSTPAAKRAVRQRERLQ